MISVTITDSEDQVVYGVPRSVSIETSVYSTIFYTLDGSTPTLDSAVYYEPIKLPINVTSVTIKVYATNGDDESAIISTTYTGENKWPASNMASVVGYSEYNMLTRPGYPFGSDSNGTSFTYGPSALKPIVDIPSVPNYPGTDGYNANQQPDGGTDKPLDYYTEVYNNLDKYGRTGYGIGTLPTNTKVIPDRFNQNPEFSSTNDLIFNPRAMVIFQDGTRDGYNLEASGLNRPSFAIPNPRVRDGAYVKLTAHEGNSPTGSFINYHYNERDQTMTYYYHDRESLRWIISKEPYSPSDFGARNLNQIVFSPRDEGVGFIFNWYPGISRKLI